MSKDKSKKIKIVIIVIAIVLAVVLLIGLTFTINNKGFRHEELLVYITVTGDCYHSEDCCYLWASSIAVGKNQAINHGYRACSLCGGKSEVTVTLDNYVASFGLAFLIEIIPTLVGLLIYGKIKKET